MKQKSFYFSGTVNLYLYGRQSLQVFGEDSMMPFSSYVGKKKSKIHIRDFRREIQMSVKHSFDTHDFDDFGRQFSSPAFVKVVIRNGKLRISIYAVDYVDKRNLPTLYLGVLRNGDKFYFLKTFFETFRPISKTKHSFALLIQG